MKDFVHLHLHTEYSLLDGMCRIEQVTRRAHEMRMPALAITDHGNLHGIIEFYEECLKHGVKPIIGSEMYLAPGSRFDRNSQIAREGAYHLTVLVQDIEGYQNLLLLSSLSHLEGFYHRPRIDMELLAKYGKGLIVLSGCLKGEINCYSCADDDGKAEEAIRRYIEILGREHFYLEMMRIGLPEQEKANRKLLELAKKYDVKIVATNDCHYLDKGDAFAHEVLLCVQTGSNLEDENRLRFQTDEFYFKSPDEMAALFSEIPAALENTVEIHEKCNLKLDLETPHIPSFQVPDGLSADEYLERLVAAGMKERFNRNFDPSSKDRITQRASYELDIIKRMNFSGYFLIIHDIVEEAHRRGIAVGPGRGSGAGSLVAYLLGITQLNPLDYDLLFERFLNPERVSLPDIDLDFSDRRREEIIAYLRKKYGEQNVAQIATFGTLGARAVVRDVARAMKMSYGEGDRIAKMISPEPGTTIEHETEKNEEIRRLIQSEPKVAKLFAISRKLEGLARHASTHAAGVVITDKPTVHYAPLFRSGSSEVATTQFSMTSIEKIGLLKIDLLGLKTLSVIEDTVALVKKTRNIDVTFREDDAKTYHLLAEGHSTGLFQLESESMKGLLRRIKPERFDDLIAILALHRPGPMQSGMVEQYIACKNDPSKIKYDHPLLEPILKPTRGVILYQEQVMQIANVIGGFNLGEADLLRKAMGKKILDLLEEQREKFVHGAKKHGISAGVAGRIFNNMAKFAGYGFNKSHSACYAVVSYQTAYLKANFPLEFMTALLNSEIGDETKIAQYIDEAEQLNIWVLPPDIHESDEGFSIVGNDIVFGLAAVKNVGHGAIQAIIEARREGPFESLHDFCQRVDLRFVNRKVVESLIKAGAFDCFERPRSQLFAMLDEAMEQGARIQKLQAEGQLSIFSKTDRLIPPVNPEIIASIPEWPETRLLAFEKEMLGVYRTGHPLENSAHTLSCYVNAWSSEIMELSENDQYWFGGLLVNLKKVSTRKGEKMAVGELEDLKGRIEVVFFPQTYESSSSILKSNNIIFVKGRPDRGAEKAKIIVSDVATLNTIGEKNLKSLLVEISVTAPRETLEELKKTFQKFRGQSKVYLKVATGTHGWIKMALPKYSVSLEPGLFDHLKDLVPPESIQVV